MDNGEWRKIKLGEVIDVKHGFAFKGEYFSTEPTDKILLTPGNFKIGGGFKDGKFKYYNGEVPTEYVLTEGDIIVTMTDLSKDGDTIGYSAKIPPHSSLTYLHNQRLGLIKFRTSEIDKNFVYWLLRTFNYQNYIRNSATGTTVRHTSPSRIKEFECYIPSKIGEQRKIASVLSSFEEKIELNRQTAQTLEAIAQALFKEWFVDFNFPGATGEMEESELGMIPKGWTVGNLGELLNFRNGKASPNRGEEFTFPVYGANGIIGYTELYNCKPNASIVGRVGSYCGVVYYTTEKAFVTENAIIAESKYEGSSLYCYNKLLSLNLNNHKSGSGQPLLNQAILPSIKLVIPSFDLIKKFEEATISLKVQAHQTEYQSKTLSQLRDGLLPKLMSREVITQN